MLTTDNKKELEKMRRAYNDTHPYTKYEKCFCKQNNIDSFLIKYNVWIEELNKNDNN